ncbi:carboxypeptidase regulatory-like domain-containing protein [Candidatus Roizmanbacteria bacterium]|nr:carboxypeptidase regulatory-like domain-containing protein [Candidatus Roizmanbacteria bacterium]
MNKLKKATVFFFLFAIFCFFPTPSLAYTSQNWQCLKLTHKLGSTAGPEVGSPQYWMWNKIEGSNLPTASNFYIVFCTQATSGYECTTGDANLDASIPVPNASKTPGIISITGGAIHQSSDTNFAGWVRWNYFTEPSMQSLYAKYIHVPHTAFAVTLEENAPSDSQGYSQQQGSIPFNTGPKCSTANSLSDGGPDCCVSIIWDPEGRTFDAVSLEPIANVNLTVLDDKRQKLNLPQVQNPVNTDKAGEYSFFVPEGDYFLKTSLPTNYRLTVNNNEVNHNYSKAYYNLYREDEKITEKIDSDKERNQGFPDPEHRDIALYPLGEPLNRPLEVLSSGEFRIENKIKYSGKLSHPLTKVAIKQNGSVIRETYADKYGHYDIFVEAEKLHPDSPVTVELNKVDLVTGQNTSLNRFRRFYQVDAQEIKIGPTAYKIQSEPILSHIEGYVYDSHGKVAENATVFVKTQSNNAVFYQTKTDSNGLLRINYSNLPIFPFYLEISSPGQTSYKQTTSAFAKNNQEYVKKNNIDLMKKVVRDSHETSSQTKPIDRTGDLKKNASPQSEKKAFGSNLLMLVAVTVIVLIAAVLIYLYLTKKKSFPDKGDFPR